MPKGKNRLVLYVLLMFLIMFIEAKKFDAATKAKMDEEARQVEMDAFESKKKDLMLRHQSHKEHFKKELLKKEQLKQMEGYVITAEKEKKMAQKLKGMGIKSFDR